MPYVSSGGQVQQRRTWLRLSLVTDFLAAVMNTVSFFFQTLMNPEAADRYVNERRARGHIGGGGGGGAQRRGGGQRGGARIAGMGNLRKTVNHPSMGGGG